MTSLLALPPELIESIIISSRSPHTLSSLSQTSRALHTLIYASPDSHLWRELFLTTWDDPRPALAHTALIHPDDAQWDWGKEYRARVNAEMCATAWRRGVCVADDATSGEDNTDALSDPSLLPTLRALLSTLLTLTPFPSSPPIALTVLTPSISPFPTGNLESGQGERRERMTSAPPLPPLLLLLASGFKAVKASKSGERMDRIVYGPHHSTPYPPLHLATPSLPPQLTRTLLPSLSIGVRGLSAHTPSLSGAEFWAEDELGQIFHRILCITGFVPIPQPLPTPSSAPRPRPDPFPSPAQQYADARILARRRVYDMRYLRADRAWGPFQVVDRSASTSARNGRGGRLGRGAGASGSKAPRSASNRPGRGLGTLAWAMGMEVDDDDEGDEDWHDAEDGDKEGSSSSSSSDNTREGEVGNDGGADDDDEESDSEPEVEHPLISLILPTPPTTTTPGRRTRRQPPGDPISPPAIKPHQLRPDYAYLAAVRIVVEANLKELLGGRSHDDEDADVGLPVRRGGGDADVEEGIPPDVGLFWEDEGHAGEGSRSGTSALQLQTPTPTPTDTEAQTFELADILARFRSLEVARIGGACGYWGGWVGRSVRRGDVRANSSSNSNSVGGGEDVRDKGKGKAKAKADEEDHGEGAGAGVEDWEEGPAGESCEGWDWAGVSGIWRRCVCWMDYRELLFFNLDPTKFLALDTQEACRIIPMELRITGYTRAEMMPVPADSALAACGDEARTPTPRTRRAPPTIHFMGSSIGSDRGLEDGRTVVGTVGVIGGGEVRWTLDTYTQESSAPGSSTPEWSSEAVQIGAAGSAVGLLGMWTGAGHERADPLGPFWAWKVA